MKKYDKPTIIDEEIEIVDVIAKSYGTDQAGDTLIDFFGNQIYAECKTHSAFLFENIYLHQLLRFCLTLVLFMILCP